MPKKLTILVAPVPAVGHMNACIGLAEVLLSRGHKVVFIVDKSYEGKLVSYGFEEELLEPSEPLKPNDAQNGETPKNSKPGEEAAGDLLNSGLLSGVSSVEKLKLMSKMPFWSQLVDKMIA